jgi:hypothetical protein
VKAYQIILSAYGIFLIIELVALVRHLTHYLPPVKRIKITLRINMVVFISGFLMLSGAVLFDINYLRYKSPVPHSNYKEISLKDFRGLKRPNQTLDGDKEFAFIVTAIKVEKVEKGLDISAYFHPARSYVFDNNIEDDHLLKHELYHFHIAEYCARLLRKQIAGSKTILTDDEIETMTDQIKVKEDSMQFKYDDESYHSYVMAKQLNWEKRIDSGLTSLSDYAGTTVNLEGKK